VTTPSSSRKWLVLAGLVPGLFLVMADALIMSITVSELIQVFGSSVPTVSWVVNGYNLVLTVLFLPFGRLADRYGRKRAFVLGLVVFTAASLGCALSPTIHWLIVFRCLQAVGGAAVVPTSLAILMGAFPQHEQGFASGLFGAISSLSAAAGPVIAGFLIDARSWVWPSIHLHDSWQLIFFINIPIGVLGIVLALALIPRGERVASEAHIDLPGIALSSTGLFCLTLALIQSNSWHWTSARVLGLFVVAAVALTLFVFWELRTKTPLFDLRLLRRRAFGAAAAGIMTVDIAMMGTAIMFSMYMIALMDFTSRQAGVVIFVMPLAGLILAPLTGKLLDRIGPRWPAVTGAVLSAVGLVALAHLSRTESMGAVMWRMALVGFGIGISLPSLMAAGMTALPENVKAAGSGVLNTSRQLGFVLGVAILIAIFGVTMNDAVHQAATTARSETAANAFLSDQSKTEIYKAIAAVENVDASADMNKIYQVARPLANVLQPSGFLEATAMLKIKGDLEKLYLDEVAGAFRWPLYAAAFFALLAAPAGWLLGTRLGSAKAGAGDDSVEDAAVGGKTGG
jgi:EmrB/QacA subfamily drug resistance transporter